MVVIQVLLSSIEFEGKYVNATFPKGAIMRYDFSLILAWIDRVPLQFALGMRVHAVLQEEKAR